MLKRRKLPSDRQPPARPRREVQTAAQRKTLFIEALRGGATVTAAAHAAGYNRRYAYTARAADEEFALDWDDAYEAGTDLLEGEAARRALEGVQRPVFQMGVKVGETTEYSDNLLILLLKGRRPERFRERMDITSDNKPVAVLGNAMIVAAKALEDFSGEQDADAARPAH